MRTQIFVLSAIFSVVGCSAGISEPPPHEKGGSANSGGKTGSGSGGTTTGSGGTGSGGYMPSSGGTTFGSGGATSGGQTNAMGGQGSGGTPQGTGGAARGGMSNMNSGGSPNPPPPGSGGRPFGAGGSPNPPPPGSGGRMGMPGAGGAAGSSSGAGAPGATCTEADKSVSSNGTGKHCGYTYEYWKDSGNGTLTLTKDGFDVNWSGINDLLGRKGIRPGSANLVVNYSADYQPSGNSYLCIYGWTKSPLVEYYIVDSWGSWRPPGGQGKVGTVSSDGGTYEVYKIAKNGPSIEGNGAFTQYWSVRTDKKTSGTITINNHFNAWKGLNMPMGSFYEVSMTVEGYQSSGKASVKFTMQ